MQRRVVITGLGVVAPNGIGKENFWDACVSGRSGIRRVTYFDADLLPTRIAGEVPDFDPVALGITPEEVRHTDRNTQFALAAANLALLDAGLPDQLNEAERDQIGVYLGSAMASITAAEQLWCQVTERGAHPPKDTTNGRVPVTLFLTHAPAVAIAAHYQLHGPCMVISTGCSSGGDAIGEAFWAIQEGQAECMLAGGTDSAMSYAGFAAFCVLRAMSTRNEEPEQASCPYDRSRDGFVMAEGAGVLLLEERERALAEAGITSAQLGYINSHGSSTPTNEVSETAAYKTVFGEQAYRIPISATKSMIGHTQGAASAIETVVTALVLERQVIPPTINQAYPDPLCDLDYVPNVARRAAIEVALTHSSGFGGVNNVLILSREDWRNRQS